jgi:hypothetical protein
MPGLNVVAGAALAAVVAVSSCTTKSSRTAPLAPDLHRWMADRVTASCSALQGQFRIAAGVEASLKAEKYRQPLLRELAGSGNPAMGYDAAATLSSNSANVLDGELRRRCPDHHLKHREDILYVPQQF